MISSGRRAGSVRSTSGDDSGSIGYSPHGPDAGQGSHAPRFGRRASPGSNPTGSGMDMDPPRIPSSGRGAPAGGGIIPRGPSSGSAPPSGAAAGSAGGMSSKLAGLQRLKEASTARLASRIPSANGRTSGETGGYVPSAMTNPQPARNLPARTNSGGRSGGFSSSAAGGSSAGPSSSSARSASTGPALAAAGRPPSGRSAGSAAGGGSSGYGGSNTRQQQQPSFGSAPSGAMAPGGGYSRNAAGGSAAGEYGSGNTAAARRQALAAPPPAPPQPAEPKPKPRPAARAPPPLAHDHPHGGEDLGFKAGGGGFGGGGFGGGGGGFGGGSIPPGAEEDVPSGPMVECPTCGRSFNEMAYSKHAKICEKVFATKRKPVNMAAKRLEGSEAVKFFDLRKGQPKSEAKQQQPAAGGRGPAARGAGLDDRPLPGSKAPKWKTQSDQLRAAMAANRQIADAKSKGMDIKNIKFDSGPSVPDDRVQCPHCGRKFAELTAERHIPKCKDIMAKPGRLAAGGGRGAHMRR
ncbi:hypothetical protein Vafri_19183 [Volvox africanus]|nr:hypothetical protein Vafri_19183 [Volvox africanus]